jgi:hypothetical protein
VETCQALWGGMVLGWVGLGLWGAVLRGVKRGVAGEVEAVRLGRHTAFWIRMRRYGICDRGVVCGV